jgi:uncharacterized protein YfaT (DUF1175 family)
MPVRYSHAADGEAFRRWFRYLAESQAFLSPQAEVQDCAALLRFAYREALRKHDGSWAQSLGLPALPPFPSPQQPISPLFDLGGGRQAHFADAQTLKQYNAVFVSREWRAAKPGDLLFYLQLEQSRPFHTMVFLGESLWQPDGGSYVIYHTGAQPGEIRRPSVKELLSHPEPRWRPVPGNPTFLGVHRWRILA